MLELVDRLELPRGVRLEGVEIVDDVRGERYPTNAAGAVVLAGVGLPLGLAAEQVATAWNLSPGQARDDVLAFAWQLNVAMLANVRPARSRRARAWSRFVLAVRLLPAGRLPHAVVRRTTLDAVRRRRAAGEALAALAPRAAGFAVGTSLVLAQPGLVAGRPDPTWPVLLGTATGAGLVAHELAHVVALGRHAAAVVLAGPRTLVLHGALSTRRALAVALAGPCLPTVVGVALATVGLATSEPGAALLACPFVGHAVAGTVAGRDGRLACGV